MNDEMLKCAHCEEELTEDSCYSFDKEGEPICESCEESAWTYVNTVFVSQNGETSKYLWCSEFGFRDGEYFEELDDEHPDGVVDWKYQRTDGWRGYHYPELEEGYVTVADGWSTGRWSDVPWKHRFNDFAEDILSGEIECPFKLIFAVGLTSNVFSTSVDVIIHQSDVDEFSEWVASEMGYSVEDLQDALS